MAAEVRIIAIEGMPEVRPGDDLAAQILDAAGRQALAFRDRLLFLVRP